VSNSKLQIVDLKAVTVGSDLVILGVYFHSKIESSGHTVGSRFMRFTHSSEP